MCGTLDLGKKRPHWHTLIFEGDWTEKHGHVARKIFLEGGWAQKRLFDIGWSDVGQCHEANGVVATSV